VDLGKFCGWERAFGVPRVIPRRKGGLGENRDNLLRIGMEGGAHVLGTLATTMLVI